MYRVIRVLVILFFLPLWLLIMLACCEDWTEYKENVQEYLDDFWKNI